VWESSESVSTLPKGVTPLSGVGKRFASRPVSSPTLSPTLSPTARASQRVATCHVRVRPPASRLANQPNRATRGLLARRAARLAAVVSTFFHHFPPIFTDIPADRSGSQQWHGPEPGPLAVATLAPALEAFTDLEQPLLLICLLISLIAPLLVVSVLGSVVLRLSGAKRRLRRRRMDGHNDGNNHNSNSNSNSNSSPGPTSGHRRRRRSIRRSNAQVGTPATAAAAAATALATTQGEEAMPIDLTHANDRIDMDVDINMDIDVGVGVGIGGGCSSIGDREMVEADEDAADRALPLPDSALEACTMDM
jgi:hypothetical protein